MAKNNIRSIRFSDDVKEIVEKMPGNGFNEKFENMVLTYAREEKNLHERLKLLDGQIKQKQKSLYDLSSDCQKLFSLKYDFDNLNRALESIKRSVLGVVTQNVELQPGTGAENELHKKRNSKRAAASGS